MLVFFTGLKLHACSTTPQAQPYCLILSKSLSWTPRSTLPPPPLPRPLTPAGRPPIITPQLREKTTQTIPARRRKFYRPRTLELQPPFPPRRVARASTGVPWARPPAIVPSKIQVCRAQRRRKFKMGSRLLLHQMPPMCTATAKAPPSMTLCPIQFQKAPASARCARHPTVCIFSTFLSSCSDLGKIQIPNPVQAH